MNACSLLLALRSARALLRSPLCSAPSAPLLGSPCSAPVLCSRSAPLCACCWGVAACGAGCVSRATVVAVGCGWDWWAGTFWSGGSTTATTTPRLSRSSPPPCPSPRRCSPLYHLYFYCLYSTFHLIATMERAQTGTRTGGGRLAGGCLAGREEEDGRRGSGRGRVGTAGGGRRAGGEGEEEEGLRLGRRA